MVELAGELAIARPMAHTLEILGDAGRLASVLPRIEQLHDASPERAAWKAHPTTKLFASTIDVENARVERGEGRVVYRTVARAIGGTVTLLTRLEIEATDAGHTLVRWNTRVEHVTGLLRMVPAGVMRSAGQAGIDDTWRDVQSGIESA